jgi:hypothetical protein
MDVRGRESQEMKSSIDKEVLSAVILDQALPVVPPVIFENEPRRGIVEIGSAHE